LSDAINEGVNDYNELLEFVKREYGLNKEGFEDILGKTSIPQSSERLIYHKIFYPDEPYISLLREIIQICKGSQDQGVIEELRQKGKENTYAYLSCKNIDIYFATSMRTREDFELNYTFMNNLLNHDKLRDLRLVYFDPTQSYIEDRIQKGLVECLMIKRAKVTVYNAQESETFGKVAEASLTIAYGKPVIIYVPRILEDVSIDSPTNEHLNKIRELYDLLDKSIFYTHDIFLTKLKDRNFITDEDLEELKSIEKEKIDIIDKLSFTFKKYIDEIEDEIILSDLYRKGFKTRINGNVREFVREKFIQFEKDAMIFRDLHPLMFQVSPVDRIPRGVFVARSIDQVARLLRAILIDGLEYKIEELGGNWALFDDITHSAIRVAPNDTAIKIALALEK